MDAAPRALRAGAGSLWDSDFVLGIAFSPRTCKANTKRNSDGSSWIDGDFPSGDGTSIAFRLYVAPPPRDGLSEGAQATVLATWHANAELCTDLETEIGLFYGCGFQAVFCPEFRGYAWGGGQPRLGLLCPDAEAAMKALPEILSRAGIQADAAKVVVHGRSLGSNCAAHIAAQNAGGVSAMVLESSAVDLLKLPMIVQMGQALPAMFQMIAAEPPPLRTMQLLRQVTVPALIIHGERDEIAPMEQGMAAHKACSSTLKKLVRYPRASHNNLRAVAGKDYYNELRLVCQLVAGNLPDEASWAVEQSDVGFLGMITRALRCVPGMRRCLVHDEDVDAAQ